MKLPKNNHLKHAIAAYAKFRYDEKKKSCTMYPLYIMVTEHILTECEHPHFTKDVTAGDP